jgi:hypothetical protein
MLMQFFEPVTWRDQSSPFFYVLACKTRKTRRGLAGEASSDDQVSPVSKEEVRRREDLLEIIDLPFILIHVICPFTLVKLKAPRGLFQRWGGIFLNTYPPILLSLV